MSLLTRGQADIISCATLSRNPLIQSEWLSPGTHLDLVGSFTPFIRESDDEVMRRGAVFVDTRDGALSETGDLIDPLKAGIIQEPLWGQQRKCRHRLGKHGNSPEVQRLLVFSVSLGAG